MTYEIYLLPSTHTERCESLRCIDCGQTLVNVHEFSGEEPAKMSDNDFPSALLICEDCGQAHLELKEDNVTFQGPVLVGWE
jgi:hypothetical protein